MVKEIGSLWWYPLMAELIPMFGDHTYFLDDAGLNIVAPIEDEEGDRDTAMGMMVNIAT